MVNVHKENALMMACENGQKEIVELLLSANVNVHKVVKEGITALFAACRGGNKDIVELLLAAGADMNKTNKYGHTPLSFILTESDPNNEIIDLLLDTNKVEVNMKRMDNRGQNILFGAVRRGSLRLTRLLLSKNVCCYNESFLIEYDCFVWYI